MWVKDCSDRGWICAGAPAEYPDEAQRIVMCNGEPMKFCGFIASPRLVAEACKEVDERVDSGAELAAHCTEKWGPGELKRVGKDEFRWVRKEG